MSVIRHCRNAARHRSYRWAAIVLLASTPDLAAAQNNSRSGTDRANDPSGAVRALGSAEDDTKRGKQSVQVPQLGGETPDRTLSVPPGTSR